MATFTILNPSEIDIDDYESDDNNDDLDLDNFIMYKNRDEWSDVTPIRQNDGNYKVVAINYLPQYEDTFNYFRSILQTNEMSKRTLKLTEDCIRFNSTNYTVWHYRRLILNKLNENLLNEFEFINKIIMKNSKNYQVWEHQKYIIKLIIKKLLNNDNNETLTIEIINDKFKKFILNILLRNDTKNYHAWQQRQWFIQEYNKFDNELQFIDYMINNNDIRNNSAWNHRYFVIKNTTGFITTNDDNLEIIKNECNYTMKIIKLAKNNESSWNYLLGLMKLSYNYYLQSDNSIEKQKCFNEIFDSIYNDECLKLYQNDDDQKDEQQQSSYLLNFMYQYLLIKMEQLINNDNDNDNDNDNNENLKKMYEKAKNLLIELMENVDTIRKQYWLYQLKQLEKFYQ